MEYLVGMEEEVEFAGKEAFWDADCVDECAKEVENAHDHNL